MRGRGRSREPWADFFFMCLTSRNHSWPDGEGFPGAELIMSVYPTPSWWVQPAQRAAGKLLKTFTTEKHTGSGIEPGFPNCEAHAFPRRHCTPLNFTYMKHFHEMPTMKYTIQY